MGFFLSSVAFETRGYGGSSRVIVVSTMLSMQFFFHVRSLH